MYPFVFTDFIIIWSQDLSVQHQYYYELVGMLYRSEFKLDLMLNRIWFQVKIRDQEFNSAIKPKDKCSHHRLRTHEGYINLKFLPKFKSHFQINIWELDVTRLSFFLENNG